jgi:6-phosphofructokinase 1
VGEFLVELIATELGIKARADKSGTIQRSFGAAQSVVDATEAKLAGAAAVMRACEGMTDQMITLVRTSNSPYHCETGTAPLEAVANAERPVPAEFISAEGNDVTPAFLEYARPLIGGPLPPVAQLRLARVAKKLG